jgi:hypothetical protein
MKMRAKRGKRGNAPRRPWQVWHHRQRGICNLRLGLGHIGFESLPLRHIKINSLESMQSFMGQCGPRWRRMAPCPWCSTDATAATAKAVISRTRERPNTMNASAVGRAVSVPFLSQERFRGRLRGRTPDDGNGRMHDRSRSAMSKRKAGGHRLRSAPVQSKPKCWDAGEPNHHRQSPQDLPRRIWRPRRSRLTKKRLMLNKLKSFSDERGYIMSTCLPCEIAA